MEGEIRREELYSLREATHFTSFGLELGDKEASALADELISEMVNKRFVVLQIQEDSYCRVQLPGVSGTLPQKNKSLFGILKQPTLKYYKKKQIGNKVYFEPIGNPFTSIISLSSSLLLNLPPCGLSYRFDCAIKNFEDIFVGKQELDKLDFDFQFKDVWEANKNNSLKKSKNDAGNIFDKLQNLDSDLAYNTLSIIHKNGNLIEKYETASANLPLVKDIFHIIRVLHEASIIYVNNYRQNIQKIYFRKDDNFQELGSLIRQYQVLKNPKKYEFDVELAIKNNQLILKHRDDEILLKDISKTPYYLLKILTVFSGEFYQMDNLNTAIKALYKTKGPKDGYKEIKGISKELHDALRISDKETLKRVKNICKMYGEESLSDLLFKIVGESIAYIPFKKR